MKKKILTNLPQICPTHLTIKYFLLSEFLFVLEHFANAAEYAYSYNLGKLQPKTPFYKIINMPSFLLKKSLYQVWINICNIEMISMR